MSNALLSITDQLDQIEDNHRFLAIDDDLAVLDYYQEIFQPRGVKSRDIWEAFVAVVGEQQDEGDEESHFDLTTAHSGEKGVKLAKQALAEQQPFTVALIDMRMPGGMDGLQTAQKLRELDPRIMVVIVTAYSDHQIDEIQKQLIRDVLFLNKPLSSDEAIQTVRMLNRNWKEREKNKVMEMQMVSHAKMAALGNMAVRIGHEINQPLSYINGMLQLQKMELQGDKALDPEQMISEVDLALEQTVRIKEIINSLRVFAHPDRSRRGAVGLQQAVDHVRRIFTGPLEAQHITFNVDIPEGLPPLCANASQFQRILTNLTSNAIDALIDYKQQAELGWRPEIVLQARFMEEREQVELVFRDNGSGIPEDLQSRMFDPFVTTKEPGRGTGLGLSEIHGMLKEHEATVEYRPDPQQHGARFVIHFPIQQGEGVEDE